MNKLSFLFVIYFVSVGLVSCSMNGEITPIVSASNSSSSSSSGSTSSSSSSGGGASSVVATLSGQLTGIINSTTLNVSIGGADVIAYQYKVGDGSTDCSNSISYSADVLIATPITESISAFADGTIILCVIGKDSLSTYQTLSSATSATWTKDTVAPTIGFSGEPLGANNITTLNISLTGIGVTHYKYKVGGSNLNCSSGVGYSASEVAVGINVTDSITGIADGTVKVCAVGRDAAGNYQAFGTATSASWTKDATAPAKPSVLSLLTPATSPNTITQPTISVGGVVTGDSIKLYKNDSTCDVANLIETGTVAPASTSIDFPLSSALSDGSYTFFASSTDTLGNTFGCSTVSLSYVLDTVNPTVPTGVSRGAATAAITETPVLTWTASTDLGGSGVASYQVQIFDSLNAAVGTPVTVVSGNKITGLSLIDTSYYYVKIRAIDSAGNTSAYSSASISWIANNSDPCSGSPTPGTGCTGGAIYLGSLSPGATLGSGTDNYMTTPGGCGEIPAGQRVSALWGPQGDYPNAFFTPTCSGNDYLQKYWNDGSNSPYIIPGLTDPAPNFFTTGTAFWGVNLDAHYGSENSVIITAITSGAQGGYHAAALYCKYLNYGGYMDWYLPNLQELHLFYTNRASIPGLDTSGTYYRSSSQSVYSGIENWDERMSDGDQTFWSGKFDPALVRCVRRY